MSEHFDARETRSRAERERDLYQRLPALIATAARAPGWRAHLGNIDPAAIDSPQALAKLPVLRKGELPPLQKEAPPFGGLLPDPAYSFARLFTSPGPIYEPEGRHDDAWRSARGLFAAGFRLGDVVLNTFSYHLTPGGFILDTPRVRRRCRPRSATAASMPTSCTPPPTSAASPTRRRRAKGWWSTRTCCWRSSAPAPATRSLQARSARWS
jgi:hypothetical protein